MLFQQTLAMHYELVGGNIVPILSLEAHKWPEGCQEKLKQAWIH